MECKDCKQKFENQHIDEHNKSCLHKPKTCSYCNCLVKGTEFNNHKYACGSRTKLCPSCNKNILIRDFEIHENLCLFQQEEAFLYSNNNPKNVSNTNSLSKYSLDSSNQDDYISGYSNDYQFGSHTNSNSNSNLNYNHLKSDFLENEVKYPISDHNSKRLTSNSRNTNIINSRNTTDQPYKYINNTIIPHENKAQASIQSVAEKKSSNRSSNINSYSYKTNDKRSIPGSLTNVVANYNASRSPTDDKARKFENPESLTNNSVKNNEYANLKNRADKSNFDKYDNRTTLYDSREKVTQHDNKMGLHQNPVVQKKRLTKISESSNIVANQDISTRGNQINYGGTSKNPSYQTNVAIQGNSIRSNQINYGGTSKNPSYQKREFSNNAHQQLPIRKNAEIPKPPKKLEMESEEEERRYFPT